MRNFTAAAAAAGMALAGSGAALAQSALGAASQATPLCQTIQAWVASEPQASSGNANAAAPALLGASFAQHFGKEYAQLTIADFRALRTDGTASCARAGILQPGQLRTASTLLSEGFQSRWIARQPAAGTAAPAGPAAAARPPAAALPAPASTTALASPGGARVGGLARPADPSQKTTVASAGTPALAPVGSTAAPTSATGGLKSVANDAKSSFAAAISGLATSAISSGTDALQSGASRLGSSPGAAKPACPSEADMAVIRRTGAKPPEGCPP